MYVATSFPTPTVGLVTEHFLSLLPRPGTVDLQTSRLLSVQQTLLNVALRPGFSKGFMTDIHCGQQKINITVTMRPQLRSVVNFSEADLLLNFYANFVVYWV